MSGHVLVYVSLNFQKSGLWTFPTKPAIKNLILMFAKIIRRNGTIKQQRKENEIKVKTQTLHQQAEYPKAQGHERKEKCFIF